MFSPRFKGLDLLDEPVGSLTPAAAESAPPIPARPSVPVNLPVGRILSALICVAYVAGAFAAGSLLLSQMAVVYLVLGGCLMLIWFPDEIGERTGYFAGNCGLVDRPTPRTLVAGAGWFFLVGLPLLLAFLGR